MADVNEPGGVEPRGTRPEDVGMKGGASGAYAPYPPGAMAAYPETAMLMRDRIRWSAIWAGLVIALVVQMILNALGVAVGLTAFKVTPTTTTALPSSLDTASAIWVGISALIALFIGGYVASRMSGLPNRMSAIMHGVVVWGLSLILGSILVAVGVSGLLGFIGSNLRLVLDAMSGRALGAAPGLGSQTATAVASYAASASWWFIITAILGLIVAAWGGLVGMPTAREIRSEAVPDA